MEFLEYHLYIKQKRDLILKRPRKPPPPPILYPCETCKIRKGGDVINYVSVGLPNCLMYFD